MAVGGSMRAFVLGLVWCVAAVSTEKVSVELLAVVLTVPAHRPHRDAIRKGWGKPSSFETLLWFIVSSQDADFGSARFSEERETFDDVTICDVASGFNRIIWKVSCAVRSALMASPRPPRVCCTDRIVCVQLLW